MHEPFNDYWLRRWSLLVRIRDDFTCQVCGKRLKHTAQAHHICPKEHYPLRAYHLHNGITVCAEHHQPLVHISAVSWRNWVPMFRRLTQLARARHFNNDNQELVTRTR